MEEDARFSVLLNSQKLNKNGQSLKFKPNTFSISCKWCYYHFGLEMSQLTSKKTYTIGSINTGICISGTQFSMPYPMGDNSFNSNLVFKNCIYCLLSNSSYMEALPPPIYVPL